MFRYGLLADIGEGFQGCPLYPQKRTCLIVGILCGIAVIILWRHLVHFRTRRTGSAAFNSTIGAGVTWHGKAPDGERGPGLLRFRMGGTSDGRECRHHHVGVVALM